MKLQIGGLAAALAFGLGLALAGPAVAKESVTECESWKNDWEIRCLSRGAGASIGGSVTLTNLSTETVTFSTQVWKSFCGLSSSDASVKQSFDLASQDEVKIDLDPQYIGPGFNSACTELFVFECSSGGKTVPCRGRLYATLTEQDTWPVGPPRDCEIWDDGTINCVSWSLLKGATHLPGTVTVQRTSTSGADLTVVLQEYDSTCGIDRKHKDTYPPELWLKPGASGTYGLSGFQGDFAAVFDLCTGLFITKCYLGNVWARCTDHIHATVQ